MPKNKELPYHSYIRTKECFFDDLVQIEAERVILDAMSLMMLNEGFAYLEHTATPVVPRTRDTFTPLGSYSVEDRLGIAYTRTLRRMELADSFGGENIWIGPQVAQVPEYPGLSESEQRGFWIRGE